MALKYDCPPPGKHTQDVELWKLATKSFLSVVKAGLNVLEEFGKVTISIYQDVVLGLLYITIL